MGQNVRLFSLQDLLILLFPEHKRLFEWSNVLVLGQFLMDSCVFRDFFSLILGSSSLICLSLSRLKRDIFHYNISNINIILSLD